jgi:class 3 adenylate cyclase
VRPLSMLDVRIGINLGEVIVEATIVLVKA